MSTPFGDVPCGTHVGACAHGPMTDVERIASGERFAALRDEIAGLIEERRRLTETVRKLILECRDLRQRCCNDHLFTNELAPDRCDTCGTERS